ncbi:hypothetical protein ACQEU6_06660 [Spirillospora sp. CA-108201]
MSSGPAQDGRAGPGPTRMREGVPLDGALPLEWGLAWRAGAETARVRAFTRAAVDLLAAG